MIATSGFLTALEYTLFVFGRGSAPDPTGELTAPPQTPPEPLAGLRGPTSKRGKRRGGRRERERRRGEEVNWRDRPPFENSWTSP